MPQPLVAEAAKTPPGKVTVFEFIDFQCPFCRRNHEALAPMLRLHQDQVRLVRAQVPLRKHANSFPAALASVCAEAQGKGDEMADLLVAAPVPRLRAEGCEEMAVELGLDIERYRTCVTDPGTADRVHREDALFDSLHAHGVPLLFIGPQRFDGLADEDAMQRALDEEIAKAAKR